jgi:hypothetical protein
VVKHFEDEVLWIRFRLSSAAWIVLTAMVAAGFINLSDSWLLVGCWLAVSGTLARRVVRAIPDSRWHRTFWFSLVCLPVSGWILYATRFPHIHAIDALADRLERDDARERTFGERREESIPLLRP